MYKTICSACLRTGFFTPTGSQAVSDEASCMDIWNSDVGKRVGGRATKEVTRRGAGWHVLSALYRLRGK